ncbi:hypothetical protein R1sor_011414 [Riccia sorocarpa]|uniref:Reverse transcriptase zinc-binding domain-containing protein n=1 Tax=Riccia sorocarpa TaxID=122646 RepID=A0ABD3I0W2_9MARC
MYVRDDRRKWLRGWHRVCLVLKEFRNTRARQRWEEGDLEAEVAWRKERMGSMSSPEEAEALARAESRLRERELKDARAWRTRSRKKWLSEDEAPSRYFFAKLRAKWARESVHELELKDGEIISDNEDILGEVHSFYQELYTAEDLTPDRIEAQKEVIGLIHARLTDAESQKVIDRPEQQEIEDVVFQMRTNKAPGLDGLTIEVVQGCWEFVGADCIKVGCDVAENGRSFRYLGVRSGVDVQGIDNAQEAIQRMSRRLVFWENSYLPWTSRVIILKHILSQIPSYTMMIVGCERKDALKLERVCRSFLWGTTQEGKIKKALVGWKRLVRPKLQGGLSLYTFEARSRALQMKQVSALMDGKDTEWVHIATQMIRTKLLSGPARREKEHWGCSDALLLLPGLRIAEAPTLDKLLQVWFKTKKRLTLYPDTRYLPSTLHVSSLKRIWKLQRRPSPGDFRSFDREVRRVQVYTFQELFTRFQLTEQGGLVGNEWQRLSRVRIGREIWRWLGSLDSVDLSLHSLPGWQWEDGWNVDGNWRRPVQAWNTMEWAECPSFANLSRRWTVEHDQLDWMKRWRLLWQGSSPLRVKTWFWRILNLGLHTNSQAKKWGVSDGLCFMCNQEEETLEHMLWSCRRLSERTKWVQYSIVGSHTPSMSFLSIIDWSLKKHSKIPAVLLLLGETCWHTWLERNDFLFRGRMHLAPARKILEEATCKMASLIRRSRSTNTEDLKRGTDQVFEEADRQLQLQGARASSIRAIIQEAAGGVDNLLDIYPLSKIIDTESVSQGCSSSTSEEDQSSSSSSRRDDLSLSS